MLVKDKYQPLLIIWGRALKKAYAGISRNIYVSTASVLSITIALTTLTVTSGLVMVFREAATHIQTQVSLVAYLEKSTPQEAIDDLIGIFQIRPEVKTVKLITPEEALGRLSYLMGSHGSISTDIDDNPIPPSLEITLNHLEDAPKMVALFQEIPLITSILNTGDTINRVNQIVSAVRLVGTIVFILFALFAIILISLTVGFAIRGRREEIQIMGIVGAPTSYVMRPFILEGLLYGLGGGIITILLMFFFNPGFTAILKSIFYFLNPLSPTNISNWWYLWIFISSIGIPIGALGAILATNRYLKEE
ncbi:MAG: Cell division protein FtsX [candidate division WS2 bacterium]|nr:Cell division protein FtsX [Candidatus Lithacetigena glycinireducens]MBT9174877.1 Cell division protein FtsX [Candidatus Lithacetigena glycinireducens]